MSTTLTAFETRVRQALTWRIKVNTHKQFCRLDGADYHGVGSSIQFKMVDYTNGFIIQQRFAN